jgi:hypothetical protein
VQSQRFVPPVYFDKHAVCSEWSVLLAAVAYYDKETAQLIVDRNRIAVK